MEPNLSCAICANQIAVGEGYVVRIDVYADPQIPPMSTEQVESADLKSTLADVIQQTHEMSTEELQDSIHRRFEYRLCAKCHKRYLANPLGMPRRVAVGHN